jgi:hypothetical protein
MVVDPLADRPRPDIDRSKLVEFRLWLDGVRLRLDGVRLRLDHVRLRPDGVRPRPDIDRIWLVEFRPWLDGVRPWLDGVRPRLDQVRPRPDIDRPGLVKLGRIVQACTPRHVELMFSDQGTVEVTYVLTQWSSIVSGGGLSPGAAVLRMCSPVESAFHASSRYLTSRRVL